MTSYTIKDLEKISGIKAHTIRIWEQRYHFLQPKRTETNIRSYSGDELKIILNVSLLNKYGFKHFGYYRIILGVLFLIYAMNTGLKLTA